MVERTMDLPVSRVDKVEVREQAEIFAFAGGNILSMAQL
jgi:hypothetical protein